jgi:hypothetical protein
MVVGLKKPGQEMRVEFGLEVFADKSETEKICAAQLAGNHCNQLWGKAIEGRHYA